MHETEVLCIYHGCCVKRVVVREGCVFVREGCICVGEGLCGCVREGEVHHHHDSIHSGILQGVAVRCTTSPQCQGYCA